MLRYGDMSDKLAATICYQVKGKGAYQVAKEISKAEGVVEIDGLASGEYSFYVCLDGQPISPACNVKVER